MPPKKGVPEQQLNPTSIQFQAECNKRATDAIESSYEPNFQAKLFKKSLLGAFILGTGVCLIGGTLLYLGQNIK